MNELKSTTMTLNAGGLPEELVYPPFTSIWNSGFKPEFDPALPEEEYRYFGWGVPPFTLPYSRLSGYTRERKPTEIAVMVLENDRLRATFIPSLGGRLWSLRDKKQNRELLYTNTVLQFGKLAIRDAWFSGGIEWNIGFPGHTPFTSAPVFTSRLTTVDGAPVLRIHEWERITGTPYQVDFFFPADDSEFLFTAVRIVNPDRKETSTYWWSNVAFPETPQTRVIVPTNRAIVHEDGIRLVDQTGFQGCDASYPSRVDHSMDFFYYIPRGKRPWEAAVQEDGKGLLCTSIAVMRGRKLFLWGHGVGGVHWSEFLSEPGQHYIEIQSGLAKTQMECVPVPPESEFFWVETFGPIELDPVAAHHVDYQVARNRVADYVEEKLSEDAIQKAAEAAYKVSRRAPEEILTFGSGWGVLENQRREADGEPAFEFGPTAYPAAALGPLQQPWSDLLAGRLPSDDALALPSWQISDAWYDKLKEARTLPGAPESVWLTFQLALNQIVRREFASALSMLEAVPEAQRKHENIDRAIAYLADQLNDPTKSLQAWRWVLRRCGLQPTLFQEAYPVFQKTGHVEEFLELLPKSDQGRIRYLRAAALLELGRLAEVEALLAEPFEIADLQEGERALSDLWQELTARRTMEKENIPFSRELYCSRWEEFKDSVPRWADFRMSIKPPQA